MISIPDIVARGQQFKLVRSDTVLETFTGRSIAMINPMSYWEFTIPVVPRSYEEAGEWRASLSQLSELNQTFQASPPGYNGALYAQGGGTPIVVDGADQVGTRLTYRNADAGQRILEVGEFFEVNGELKVCKIAAVADGSGTGTINFEPALRRAPGDGDSIELLAPKATFRLQAPVASWTLQPNRIHNFNIIAVETYS